MDIRKFVGVRRNKVYIIIGSILIFVLVMAIVINSFRETGIYPATYSFDGETGLENEYISFVTYCMYSDDSGVIVVEEKKGHKEVMMIYDNDAHGSVLVQNMFPGETATHSDEISEGTISFYILLTNSEVRNLVFILMFYGAPAVLLTVELGSLVLWDTGVTVDIGIDVWYKFEIIFDCDNDMFDLIIDNKIIDEDINMENSVDYVDRVWILTSYYDSGYEIYYDAIDYSWVE